MCIRDRSSEQQLALVRAYVKDNFVDKGMCADFAIHDLSLIHIYCIIHTSPVDCCYMQIG